MKATYLVSAFTLALALAGCGGSSTTDGGTASQTQLLGRPVKLVNFPSYNTNPLPADMTGMSNNALQTAALIKGGFNIGNSLEATGGETNWGNPVINLQFIQLIKASGFTAVRLPVAWNQYADQSTGKISDAWLSHVKSIVQMCVDNGLYVIVNAHWDGGWLDSNITTQAQPAVNAKQKAFWEQIATTMRDFDGHLMFAGTNEPPAGDATAMSVLLSYEQTFINAVRSTGGKNAYRVLVFQGPYADIDKTNTLMTTLPTDSVPGRLMAEVHFYIPYNFTLMTADASWGNQFYYWGTGYHSTTDVAHNATWGEEAELEGFLNKTKTQFIDKGIPVVIGEYGAYRRSGTLTGANLQLHLDSHAYFLNYVAKSTRAKGMLPFYWDEGFLGNNSFGILNRQTNTVFDQQSLTAIINGANGQ